jgi:hypothetical protein
MGTRPAALLALAAVLAALPAIALGGTASNSQTYPDAVGDNADGIDVSAVVVSNDDAGLLSFRIDVTNRPALTPDLLFQVYVDSRPGAGDAESFGADHVLQLTSGGVALFTWDGTNYPVAASQAGVAYSWASGGPTLRVSAAALGKPATINVVVVAVSGVTEDAAGNADYSGAHGDLAPNFGLYTGYEIRATLKLTVARTTTSPRPARAGKPFSVGLAVTRNDTGGPISSGQVTCTARVGARAVPVQARRVRNGVAACSWRLPAGAQGSVVRGTIVVAVDGVRVSRTFSARITA